MKKIIILCSSIVFVLVIGGFLLVNKTFAFCTSRDDIYNSFKSGDVSIQINENFTPPKNWKGEEYPKEVSIKNESKVDSLIRVRVTPRWVDENGKLWPGDTSFVKISFQNVKSPDGAEKAGSDAWIKDVESDYYYYGKIEPKDSNTVNIIKSVSANVPENLKSRYKGKTLKVDVKSEVVQASKEAIANAWSDIQNQEIKNMLNNLCKY